MSSHKAPQGYQPTGQGAADQGYQTLTGDLANAGSSLYASTAPAFAGVTGAVQNNPYYQLAQSGADNAAAIGTNYVAPAQFQGAQANQFTGNVAGAESIDAIQQGQGAGATLYGQGQQTYDQAQQAYAAAMGLLPQMMTGFNTSPDLMTSANKTAGQLQGAIPAAAAGYSYASPMLYDAMTKANTGWDESQAMMPLTTANLGAAQQILNTGFDPQRTLYDRSYQQMMEHQNAINSQQGVSGSPFAAGVTGDASKNFDIDWQNAQLGRQTQALGAFDSAMSTDAGNFSTLLGAGTGAYTGLQGAGLNAFNSLTDGATANLRGLSGDANTALFNANQGEFTDKQTSMNDATQRYAQMLSAATGAYGTMAGAAQGFDSLGQGAINSGVANFNSLAGTQQNAYANASDLGAAGLNTLTTASMYPNQVYMNNQNQILQALQAQVQGTNSSMDMTQAAIGDYGNYMSIGQNATKLAQNATSINNAASAATWAGIGQLAGLAMAPFTGGMSLAAAGAAGGK